MRKAFALRIDPELWKDLEEWSHAELRSVNGQIEYLLRQAVLKRKGGGRSALGARSAADEKDGPMEGREEN
ncbi:MAG: hypothetical protein A3K19_22375 [Lentisphaerae bacterium RIFOXYB12_FULL_65_16]|nr:MAG: hypothetical protein A3K18_31490 [Lentisphaerae bacterium RIFOXYA12_64_32]OGV91957.1 MAG: hypothetical protein A3K19_22375 [Lentisphaerae bacterium RIFOXYB12_FULL_65_16]